MPERCPDCNHPAEPGALACVNCPASWEDEGEDYHRPVRRGRLSDYGVAGWFAILAVVVGGSWWAIATFLRAVDPDNEDSVVKGFVEERVDQLDPAVARATKGGGPNTWGAPTKTIYGSTTEGVGGKEVEDAEPASSGDIDPSVWTLNGRVIDLVTLQPIPKALMVFEDPESGKRRETSTDSQGRYRLKTAPLQGRGYYVRVLKDGYATSYLNPGAENVPQMPLEDRQSLAGDVARSMDGPYTVQPYSSDPLTTDFYLAPKK